MIRGVCDGDVPMVTRGLDVVSRSIDDIKEALKQMHGNAAVHTSLTFLKALIIKSYPAIL